MFFRPDPLHFTGIGGIGMSGLAEIARAWGSPVTGSDLQRSATTQRLESLGIRVSIGHAAENIGNAKALIVSSAVQSSNPEVLAARQKGLPIVRRGELLAEFMRHRLGVAIGGSHGKTTTTAMAASIALEAALDPTIVVGGRLPALDGANARAGGGEVMIAESDESDGSFLDLSPVISVITNIDREHLDHYKDLAEIRAAFLQFATRPPYYGAVVMCMDDPNTAELAASVRRRVTRYGHAPSCDVRILEPRSNAEGSRFRLRARGEDIGEFRLAVLGAHNILNATAAAAVALELRIPPEIIRRGLEKYGGVQRRLEVKGSEQGITVLDDYGHHPTEIRATLAAARLENPKRLVVLFQPHRYTRTKELMDEFAASFVEADVLRIADIYPASEEPIAGVSAEELVRRIKIRGHKSVKWTGSLMGTVAHALTELAPGDLVITLGAGSITQAGELLLKGLRGNAAEQRAAATK